ncbi:MAG: hypothetical protein D6759_01045 [Chloroflexi bacterium]|nr:MAG: hypothetical protein D6759_01045 [Chloroflexota bacterium]
MEALERSAWLVQTKLHPPALRSDLILREHLLARLREGLRSHRLILLSAPAGYGKTTLLTNLVASFPDFPLAWLSLDEGENDPVLFLAYLIAALQRLDPHCGATVHALLRELPQLPHPGMPVQRVVGVLINEIAETMKEPFALVLDDLYRMTEPTVYVALDYLLQRMPPPMRLVIATRYDPPLSLARLRAQGEMLELRVPDLHFAPGESAAFLNGKLGLGLSPEELRLLQGRTEGWPAGLRLLADSLSRIPISTDRAAFITHFAHTDRYVFDFLADEVLAHQQAEVRTFLLETSVLEELTAPLCNAVTGRTDAQAILEELDRRSLFVVALDEAHTTFRYHTLFAQFLRQRLEREEPKRVVTLHRRAAQALEAQQPYRAIGHYLAAEMWEEAARLIEQVGEGLLWQGLLNTLAALIDALPTPVREAHPRLIHFRGICAWQLGDVGTAQSLLRQALRGVEAAGDRAGCGEVLGELAACALLDADLEEGDALIQQALAYPVSPPTRVQLLMERAYLRFLQGDQAQALADFDAAIALARSSDTPDSLRALIFYLTPFSTFPPGGPERVEAIYRYAMAHLGDRTGLLRALLEGLMAFACFWRGHLEQAIGLGEAALAKSEALGGHPFLETDVAALMAVVHNLRGEGDVADRYFERLFRYLEIVALDEAAIVGFLYLLGRTRWLQGRLEEARRVYDRMTTTTAARELPFAPVLRLMMRGLLEMAEGDYRAAEHTLRQAVRQGEGMPTLAFFGSPSLLLARLLLERGHPAAALERLIPLLAAGEEHGAPGLLLREGALVIPLLRLALEEGLHKSLVASLLDLLTAGESRPPFRPPVTDHPLTPREVEVLRLIATGASNRAIAEQLVISPETVKSHVSHILRKLDVDSRVQAAVRARELGILPPARS